MVFEVFFKLSILMQNFYFLIVNTKTNKILIKNITGRCHIFCPTPFLIKLKSKKIKQFLKYSLSIGYILI